MCLFSLEDPCHVKRYLTDFSFCHRTFFEENGSFLLDSLCLQTQILLWCICIFPILTTEKDLNADRKLSKLDVRSPFSRIHSSRLLVGVIISNMERHTFSPWLNSKWWFRDFPPRIHRRSIPQTRCQPQLVTFQLPNITRISSSLSVVPVYWQHLVLPTLEEKLHNNLLIIHCYSPFSMLALSQLHPLLFFCSHANIYVTKPILCNGDG